jgi:hypothetical protein
MSISPWMKARFTQSKCLSDVLNMLVQIPGHVEDPCVGPRSAYSENFDQNFYRLNRALDNFL